jgi:hypothetical protein
MSNKPLMTIHAEGDTLVLRCPLSLHPRLAQLYEALRRSIGHPELARASFALLANAIALCAPSLEDAQNALDRAEAADAPPSQVH